MNNLKSSNWNTEFYARKVTSWVKTGYKTHTTASLIQGVASMILIYLISLVVL